jgi:futalosine hydrolase
MNHNGTPPIPFRVLVMTAVAAEREAVLRGLGGDARFDVVIAGVGPALAATRTARALIDRDGGSAYSLVISAGIGGGFPERAGVGSLVVADTVIAADLGAETGDGFLSVDELGFGSATAPVDTALAWKFAESLHAAGLVAALGPVLTVTTATGSAATAEALAARIPGAAAEAMEGYGVAVAAAEVGVSALELRAVSNAVGPRDRSAWRIGEALGALEAAMAILKEVLPNHEQ